MKKLYFTIGDFLKWLSWKPVPVAEIIQDKLWNASNWFIDRGLGQR
jgi:hypothetical protein